MAYFDEVCTQYTNIRPTPYKISTITATGDVNAHLHLDVLFRTIPLTTLADGKALWGFSSVQFSVDLDIVKPEEVSEKKGSSTLVRRSALDSLGQPLPVQRSSRRKRRPTRHFDNQCTLIYWEQERLAIGVQRGVNVKCFRNGRVQMTGIRNIVEGSRIVDRLVETISAIQVAGEKLVNVAMGDARVVSSNYKVCLINSDFHIGFHIRRDVLHDVLSKSLGLVCSFEPCIYPGVKLSFMWNHSKTAKNEKQNGRCRCAKPCKGTGDGYGPGNCRRVTCAIFQSGCTIITGAHTYTQLEDTYRFVCDVISKEKDRVQRKSMIIAEL